MFPGPHLAACRVSYAPIAGISLRLRVESSPKSAADRTVSARSGLLLRHRSSRNRDIGMSHFQCSPGESGDLYLERVRSGGIGRSM